MEPSKVFEHSGTIEDIRDNLVKIKMKVSEACGTCKVKNVCGSISSQERILEMVMPNNTFHIGEEVQVIIKQATGFKAVLFGYVIPTLLLLATLFSCYAITKNEGIAALASIIVLVPYFFIIYKLKNKLTKSVSFTLQKKETGHNE